MVKNFSQDYNDYDNNNYINISIYNNNTKDAAVTLMVRDRPHKSDLLSRGHLGSIPRRGDSALKNSYMQNVLMLKEDCYNEI